MALVWQSILIFNKHLEQLSALMLLKCFEMNTELTQRDTDGDSWRERKRQTNRDVVMYSNYNSQDRIMEKASARDP